MDEFGLFERVYVETEWYDGPRTGIADIHSKPHRFKSLWDEKEDEYLSTFEVWPVSPAELELEIEQWCLFVAWNSRYESGEADADTHPGHGHDVRWNEIDALVKNKRNDVPLNVQQANARLKGIARGHRYEVTGPSYLMCWKLL